MMGAPAVAQDNLDDRGGVVGPFATFDEPFTINYSLWANNPEGNVITVDDYLARGLYTEDGSTLVQCYCKVYSSWYVCFVKPGTTTIAEGALIAREDHVIDYLFIPKTVTYIAPRALRSVRDVVVYDSATRPSQVSPTPSKSDAAEEAARFGLNGVRMENPERGVNIVRMTDNTTRKELVR